MSHDQPSNPSDPGILGRHLRRLAEIAKSRGVQVAPSRGEFVQQFAECETHGRYAMNMQDENGTVRWFPGGCPACAKQLRARSLASSADLSPRFLHCTFENYRVENPGQRLALEACRDYADKFEENRASGRCMILRGNPGTGKNHLSAAIMLQIMRKHPGRDMAWSALRIKASTYLDEYWAKGFGERESWLSSMARVDLLVIDEIGRASNTKAANDAFFRIIDARYENMRPTIIISNLDREGLRETLGVAAYDRLTEGGGRLLNFDWSSERGKQTAS